MDKTGQAHRKQVKRKELRKERKKDPFFYIENVLKITVVVTLILTK